MSNDSQNKGPIDVKSMKQKIFDSKFSEITLPDSKIEKKIDGFVMELFDFSGNNSEDIEKREACSEQFGLDVQRKAARQSELLQAPLKKISSQSNDGNQVSNSLIDLKLTVEKLDPAKFNFEPGWLSRILGYLPFIGSPIKRYFSQYESAQTAIDAIIKSLQDGRAQLQRDNVTLAADKKTMKKLSNELEQSILTGQLIDEKVEQKLEKDLSDTDSKYVFMKEKFVFPLRQRIMDLQQQLAVNQQGVLATEVIIKNNKELIQGVDRALNVTVSALEVAVTVAMALADQKIVLDKITALTNTTNSLIASTALQLKNQGASIQKKASSAQLDMSVLKKAFADINEAMQEVSNFRLNALPQMKKEIFEMDKITQQAGEAVKKLDKIDDTKQILEFPK